MGFCLLLLFVFVFFNGSLNGLVWIMVNAVSKNNAKKREMRLLGEWIEVVSNFMVLEGLSEKVTLSKGLWGKNIQTEGTLW